MFSKILTKKEFVIVYQLHFVRLHATFATKAGSTLQ